ncbi:T9SS type A sorting domain-containing protein [Psychroserpens sp.]|jgi:plastocyanin|uniref:T9SS type A sorting domain-containing protein n=1 Tax=Psychroserpens sp. TaxID=2020870 RepID=UPI0039E40D85
MKRILLIAICFLTCSFGFAQPQTITIPWEFFVVPRDDAAFGENSPFDTRFTIEVGDTVTWEWTPDQGSHNVKSVAEQSIETFGTPDLPGETNSVYFATVAAPYSFSHTFTVPGVNSFQCTPHSSFMYGVITVVPAGTLSLPSVEANNFSVSPNPAKNKFTLDLETFANDSTIEVYDVLGKKILNRKINAISSTFDVSSWNSGLYIIKVSSQNTVLMKRFVKQ